MSPRVIPDGIADAVEREASDADDLLLFDLPGNPTRLALATQDLLVDTDADGTAELWIGIGGAMVLGTAEEPLELDGEGMEVQFVAVDTPAANFVQTFTRQAVYGARFAWHVVHWHRTGGPGVEGTVKGVVTLHAGIITGGITIRDVHDDDGSRVPGTVLVTFRSQAPLSMLDIRRGIQTNPESYQRWYPGDMFMSEVADTQVRKIYWGFEAPEREEEA